MLKEYIFSPASQVCLLFCRCIIFIKITFFAKGLPRSFCLNGNETDFKVGAITWTRNETVVKNREIKRRVYGKRQTANVIVRLRISQNRKQADKNCPEQFLCMKLAWNYLFLSRSNKQLTAIKEKTWSRGTNSRLLFGVNVNLNLCNNV